MHLNRNYPWKRLLQVLQLAMLAVSWAGCSAANAFSDGTKVSQPANARPYPRRYRLQRATIPRAPRLPNLEDSATRAGDYLSDLQADGFYCWPTAQLPVKVYFQPGADVSGYRSKFADCLSSCFDEWTSASNGKISWVRVFEPAQANIKVRWTNTVTERAEGTEAGRTKTFASLNTVTNRGTIHGAEMLLLTRLPDREFTASEIRRAYLHEVGHAFGIAGHSHNPTDIMYYAVTQHANPHLDDRDKATINHLYNG